MNILVLNAGSSSQKCALYRSDGPPPDAAPPPVWEAHADGAELRVRTGAGAAYTETLPSTAPAEALPHLLKTLWDGPAAVLGTPDEVAVVGHRVVHGGRTYRDPTVLTPAVEADLAALSALAPAHNPAALAGIGVARKTFAHAPQVAVFDTAFHATLPDAAAVYPGPYRWADAGLRRYGFHGISHAYAAGRAAELLSRPLAELRLVTCHLGNGCSLAAVRGGRSVDTTMGFTPLEGLMMGTRSGSVDPGLLLYLLREEGVSADELAGILNRESGLKGLSGLSGDLREVGAAADAGDARATLALAVYVHRIRFHVGAMLPSLGGLEALVFTGGVGENSARVRREVCEAFRFLGLELDEAKNEVAPVGGPTDGSFDRDVAATSSQVRALVVRAREEWSIARSCYTVAGAVAAGMEG